LRNRVTIDKNGLESMVRHTIGRNPDLKLHERRIIFNISNSPVRMRYVGASSVAVSADIDVRYGVDVAKTVDKASTEIRDNLMKFSKVNVKSLDMNVKDIFDEKETVSKN